MEEDKPEIKITINQAGVIDPALKAIKNCSQFALFGIKSSEQITRLTEHFSGDDQYLRQQFGNPDPFQVQKDKYLIWLITKCFEEIINGISTTLIEAYRYIFIYDMFKGTTGKIETTLEDINEKLNNLREQSARQTLPALFDKIRPYLTSPLYYENHIKTLNKARICLVHRNGKVTPEDMNTDNSLKIKWVRYFIFYYSKDGETEIVPGHITKEEASLKLKFKEEGKEFKLNEIITFHHKELQEFMTTCHVFLMDLASKLPIIK